VHLFAVLKHLKRLTVKSGLNLNQIGEKKMQVCLMMMIDLPIILEAMSLWVFV
jgi:hypothetical protein